MLIGRVFRSALRERRPLAVMLLDVDHFKSFNDHHGHLAGDNALRKVAAQLRMEGCRPMDISARYGGEEFVAVWYDAEPAFVERQARDILKGIESLQIRHAESPTAEVLTASAGLVYLTPAVGNDTRALLDKADSLLYQAKQQGRNQLVVDFQTTVPGFVSG